MLPLDIAPGPAPSTGLTVPVLLIALVIAMLLFAALAVYYRKRPRA